MPSQSHMLQSLAGKLHDIHPAAVLPVVALTAWYMAPAIAIGEPSKPSEPGAIQSNVDATRSALGFGPTPYGRTTPNWGVGATTAGVAPLAVAPQPTIIRPYGGGLSAAGEAGGNSLGGGDNGSGGGSAQQKSQHPMHAGPPAASRSPGSIESRRDPTRTGGNGTSDSGAENSTRSNLPPHQLTAHPVAAPPLAPPIHIVPQPVTPGSRLRIVTAPPVAASPLIVRPPVFVVPPMMSRPFGFSGRSFGFGRPMMARPFGGGGGGGFRGHR
jgi:hypothetical protein